MLLFYVTNIIVNEVNFTGRFSLTEAFIIILFILLS